MNTKMKNFKLETMYKIVHIKNIDSDSFFLLKSLSVFNKSLRVIKDTFILKDVSTEAYNSLLDLKKEIKQKQNKEIIISHE
jgi:hypothetical protein